MTTDNTAPVADSSGGFTPQANESVMPSGMAEPAAPRVVFPEDRGKPAPAPVEQTVPVTDLRNLQAAKDREMAAMAQQMQLQQDALFEVGLAQQGIEGEQLNVARQRYYSERQLQQQAGMVGVVAQDVARREYGLRLAHAATLLSQETGVPREVVAKGRDAMEMADLAIKYLSRQGRNQGRSTNVDRGGGGAASVDWAGLSGTQKIAAALRMRNRGG